MASGAGIRRERRTVVVEDWTACLRRERDGWLVGDVTRLSPTGAARVVTPLPLGRRAFPTPETAAAASADWLRAAGFLRGSPAEGAAEPHAGEAPARLRG